jgi:outer membrane receptor protein involved in Fe transport
MLIKRKYLFGTTILAGVMAVAAPAFAQSQLPGVTVQGQSDGDVTQIGEVVITGSRIRRDPTNSPTPLITISGEDLQTTGQSTIIDYLATIPALSNSVVPSDTTGSNLGDGGLSLPNLRSLGSGRTLTLIDGRRQVGSNGGSLAVDVDTIPRLLIENIEIVTGGASSVYGADAVSGVLNFVLRKDFEGLEIDANYGMINQGGEANKRISALIGTNLLDDRLNLWAFAEYEDIDDVDVLDIDWLRASSALLTTDVDQTGSIGALPPRPNDGVIDSALFMNRRTLQIISWGQTTLANTQQPSPLLDPDIPYGDCSGFTSVNCYGVTPGKTFVYEGSTARLADFGTRIGTGAINRPSNIGGDGENAANFGQKSRVPSSTAQRYAAGLNFAITPHINLSLEAKYITEDTFDTGQPTFFDVNLVNSYAATSSNIIRTTSQFDLRWTDNAFLPANVKTAIQNNTLQRYLAPSPATPSLPGQPTGPANQVAQYARHSMWGPDRTQDNTRELQRYVFDLNGDLGDIGFIKNVNWDLSYVYGVAEADNTERGLDIHRFALAADAVIDAAGLVSGTPGQIVCRSRLLQAQGLPVFDYVRGGNIGTNGSAEASAAVASCVPLNIFGAGNQSEAALNYIDAAITTHERNEQEQAIAFVAGELWDFFGAGPIGVAVGAEYRREYTEAVGRDADTGDRLLFLNTGPDFPGAEYESEEVFAELSIPLMRDTWLGEYAELSGSYRSFDYTTVGTGDVYGVNFVYRPIQDIAFKASYNTSFRAPNLGENFSPFTETFANSFVDPCATAQIIQQTTQIRANRVANCETLAVADGFAPNFFDFNGNTATTTDDFAPVYASGISGLDGGNPDLRPEESESFTFSTVIEPRFFPNFSLVLDYYEIRITDVIQTSTAASLAANCVNGDTGLSEYCQRVFRNVTSTWDGVSADPASRSSGFAVGAPSGDPIGGFIAASINFAALETRGLDFTARYSLDTEEMFGNNWGRFDYSIRGLWLIEQKNYLDATNLTSFSDVTTSTNYPRVRFTSSLTWTPNDTFSVNWTADWQAAQDSSMIRDLVANGNVDARLREYMDTGTFTRHDFTLRINVNDQLNLRTGVVNAFDAEQPAYLGQTLVDNMDPYGTRFFIGLNYRPW